MAHNSQTLPQQDEDRLQNRHTLISKNIRINHETDKHVVQCKVFIAMCQ